MPGFIADASATLPWCFASEATPWTEALLDRLQAGDELVVPAHWSVEVMNGLVVAVRRNRIGLDRIARFAADLSFLAIRVESPHAPPTWSPVLSMSTKHNLTVYDAAYLELAKRTALPLATLDGDLQKAALAENVVLL